MTDLRTRLAHCFSLAFPTLDPSHYATATPENTAAWDSVAHVTLLNLIGEEFGMDIDFEEFEGANSFDSLAERIARSGTG